MDDGDDDDDEEGGDDIAQFNAAQPDVTHPTIQPRSVETRQQAMLVTVLDSCL